MIVDLRDPRYSSAGSAAAPTEFAALPPGALAPGGLMVAQAGSPYSTDCVLACIISTIRSAGYAVTPYHAQCAPTFGDWGFALARLYRHRAQSPAEHCPALRFLGPTGTRRPRPCFPGDIRPCNVGPDLANLHIVEDMRHGGWD